MHLQRQIALDKMKQSVIVFDFKFEPIKQFLPSMHPPGPRTVPAGQMLHFIP